MAGYFTGNNYRRRAHRRFGSGNHHTFDGRLSAVNRQPPAGQGSWFYPAGHAATQSFEQGGISTAGGPFFGDCLVRLIFSKTKIQALRLR